MLFVKARQDPAKNLRARFGELSPYALLRADFLLGRLCAQFAEAGVEGPEVCYDGAADCERIMMQGQYRGHPIRLRFWEGQFALTLEDSTKEYALESREQMFAALAACLKEKEG